jgi:hypothetical protein
VVLSNGVTFQWQAMVGNFCRQRKNMTGCLDRDSETSSILVCLCRSASHCRDWLESGNFTDARKYMKIALV